MTLKKPFWRRFWLALVAVIAGNLIYLAFSVSCPATPGTGHFVLT